MTKNSFEMISIYSFEAVCSQLRLSRQRSIKELHQNKYERSTKEQENMVGPSFLTNRSCSRSSFAMLLNKVRILKLYKAYYEVRMGPIEGGCVLWLGVSEIRGGNHFLLRVVSINHCFPADKCLVFLGHRAVFDIFELHRLGY